MANSLSTISVDIKGLKDVDARLASLGTVAGAKVMRSVLFASTKPILYQAKENARALVGSADPRRPSGSGALEKSIRRVYLRARGGAFGSGTRFTVAVAPKAKDAVAIALAGLVYRRKRPARGIYWGHLVEWGFTARNGKAVPGQGIFRKALQSAQFAAVSTFRLRIARAVERALRKQNAAE